MVRIGVSWILGLSVLSGCARSHIVGSESDAEPIERGDECQEQIEASQDGLPVDLFCTGLYERGDREAIADGVEAFQPAYALWSDDAGKSRWIKLPRGEKIDSSDPGRWRFPVNTMLWKQFDADGAHAETRVYQKVRDDKWLKATYIWDDDGEHATREGEGRQFDRNGVDYLVPPARLCDDCHEGHPDNVLGFEAVSLGLPGADTGGLTLQKLVDQDLLSDPPENAELTIGDDGTGKAADVLGWLHINCGVACHNDGVNSEAEKTGLRMKLDPTVLDGRPSNDFQTFKLLIDVEAVTQQWQEQKRIVPGKPEESLLYKLITSRIDGTESNNKQMPPLATRIVDDVHADKIREWILALGER
ncbi:MAG TPA: hypothetical protein VJV78_38750 [Polyangiales bacterium]|nr:hypothetical protein [Polyangiales bacterium]